MENPIKMDDLGGKPTIFGKHPYDKNRKPSFQCHPGSLVGGTCNLIELEVDLFSGGEGNSGKNVWGISCLLVASRDNLQLCPYFCG